MARSGRGGYQKPSRPAAVSGPGALSQRTDGGPSVETKGLDYGDNKAVNDLAASAPMAPSGAPGAAAPGPRRASPQQGPDGIFAPSDNPNEPMTAGVDWGAGPGSPPNPQIGPADEIELVIRQAYALTQSPHLLKLLDRVVR